MRVKAMTAATQPSSTRSCTKHSHRCPPSSQLWLPWAPKASASLALLFCYSSHRFCYSPWKDAAVGGAEQLSSSPLERGRSTVHLACVAASNTQLDVRHLVPRTVGAAQASCPIHRSHISNHLPQHSSSSCRIAQLYYKETRCPGWIARIMVSWVKCLYLRHSSI